MTSVDKWFHCTSCVCFLLCGGSAIKALSAPSTCEGDTNRNSILISWESLTFTVKSNETWTWCPWGNIRSHEWMLSYFSLIVFIARSNLKKITNCYVIHDTCCWIIRFHPKLDEPSRQHAVTLRWCLNTDTYVQQTDLPSTNHKPTTRQASQMKGTSFGKKGGKCTSAQTILSLDYFTM